MKISHLKYEPPLSGFQFTHAHIMQYQPLRAAIEALDRFRTLGQDLESQAATFEEKRRSMKHRIRDYRADVESLRAAERHLIEQLSQSHEDNRRWASLLRCPIKL